ncbi:MAG: type III pantothenate kinase [Candidatus Omnitrophota bacterium]
MTGGILKDVFYFPGRIRRYIGKAGRIIAVSVSPVRFSKLKRFLGRQGTAKLSVIGEDISIPIKSKYNAREIGQDRLVTAYAARELYGAPVLVIDFGTAVTFDIVSRKGVYLGGLIFPGIRMALEALHNRTALLPEIELREAKKLVGRDTTTSIRNGLVYGYSHMCTGIIGMFMRKFKGLKIVSTGGNVKLIKKHCPKISIIDKNLCLAGLALANNKLGHD